MHNVLVIKLRYIGDVLLTTPVLQAVKAHCPHGRLTMAVNRGTEEVLLANPHVDELLVLDKGSLVAGWGFALDLRRRKFDTVLDLTDGDRSALLSRMSGAPIRIGFNAEHRWRGLCYTEVVQPEPGIEHRIDRDLQVLKPISIPTGSSMPRLWVTPEEQLSAEGLLDQLGIERKHPLVVLQPGARYWFKAWPFERFAELADHLADEYGWQVLIGGSRQDVKLADRIRRAAKSNPINIAGRATLRQFAAIVRQSAMFIGNDSGAMHIASAVRTPVVALFGPSSPREWGPRGGPVEVVDKGLDCHGRSRRSEQDRMLLISVEEVSSAVQRVYERRMAEMSLQS